jgi:hypothetical protein
MAAGVTGVNKLMRLPGGTRREHGRQVLVNRRVLAGDADQLADAVRFTEAPHLGRNRPAAARLLTPETDRSAFLTTAAAQWTQLDPARYPFLHQMATQLPEHDDREQYLAGINLILAGVTIVR